MKYVVLKTDDITEYMTEKGIENLQHTLNYIANMRQQEGKNPYNTYLVLNIDTPYAAEIYAIMHENGHTPCADCAKEKNCPPHTYCRPDCTWLKLRDRALQIIDYRARQRGRELSYKEGR